MRSSVRLPLTIVMLLLVAGVTQAQTRPGRTAATRDKAAPAAAPAPYVPGPHPAWEQRAAGDVGMDAGRVKAAVDFAIANEVRNPRDLLLNHYQTFGRNEPYDAPVGPIKDRGPATGLIVHRGYIVASWGEPGRVDMTHSVTKSFLSTTVGLAFDRGLIPDLNARVGESVPIDQFASAHNATITWDHLLRQTSDWEGTLWGKPEWADRPDADVSTWTTRARRAPGSTFEYNDVRVNVLALAALNIWRRPLPQVLREFVMDPIGASPAWRWYGYDNAWVNIDGQMMQSVSGGGHWGGGMFISAFDQARFGLLTLRRGRWGDRQILSEKWVSMALTPTPAQPTYGFMNWYLNTDRKLLPSAPATAFYHLGNGTNMVYADPEHDLVVVARWIEGKAMDGLVERVIGALADTGSRAEPPAARH